MNVNIFEKKMSNMFVENRLLKFGLIVMLVASVSNHILLQKAINTHKTILVPASLNTRVQILGDKASDEYVKMFAQVTSGLAFTYTPQTVANNFGELLTMFAPEAYPATKKILTELAETIVMQRLSNVFYIQGIEVDSSRNVFQIRGQQMRWVEGAKIENVQKQFEFGYKISDGRFLLLSLSEIGVDNSRENAATPIEVDAKKSPILHSDTVDAEVSKNGGVKK
jgi:conjugal transfer pilus assembly protein TraE